MAKKRRIRKGRFLRFLLIIGVIAAVFLFHEDIGRFVYAKTGFTWFLSENEKHELAITPAVNFVEVTPEQNEPEEEDPMDEQLNLPAGNNVLGISYHAIGTSPQTLSIQSNTVYRIRVTASSTSTDGNVIYTEYQAKVKKVYKGQQSKEINFSMMGGSLAQNQLQAGNILDVAEKTSTAYGDTVNLIVDGQEPLSIGGDYIMFANNQNGIITATSGSASFFSIRSRQVTRNTIKGEEPFEMSLSEFEKTYLK